MNNGVVCAAQRRLFSFCFVTSVSHYPLEGNVSSHYKCTVLRLPASLFPVLGLLPGMGTTYTVL